MLFMFDHLISAYQIPFQLFFFFASYHRQLKSNANSIHKNLAFVLFLGWVIFTFGIGSPDLGKVDCFFISVFVSYEKLKR